MNVLIGCEESGTVREAFAKLGHNAWSCDLLPSRKPGNHYQCDVREVLTAQKWHLMIAFPPCTFMANSGAKHLYIGKKKENGVDKERWKNMVDAALFFKSLWESDIPHIAMENPVMLGYAKEIIGSEQTQIIQPWQFGHPESKQTCLWLKNLPELTETCNVYDEMLKLPKREAQRIHHMPPSEERQRERSVTYPGIAQAMAEQWCKFLVEQS